MASSSDPKLAAVPTVDIDEKGRFKYVLIKLYPENAKDEKDFKYLVRGYAWAGFHADIYEDVYERVKGLGLDTECVGGGRIEHDPEKRKIKVYGYSQGYGQAKHSIACELLRKKYYNYDITWSNDGY